MNIDELPRDPAAGSDDEADVLAAFTNALNVSPADASALRERYSAHPTLPHLMDVAARLQEMFATPRARAIVEQLQRVEAFGKAYLDAVQPRAPWESAAHLVLSVGLGTATDVLHIGYPTDLLAPKLVDAGLDGDAGAMLTEAERRLVIFGGQLHDAKREVKEHWTVPDRPVFSTREAMREAGVPDWELGKGVSSADAIRLLAQQRDEARRQHVRTHLWTWVGPGKPTLREHAEHLYPGEGERLFPDETSHGASK